LEHRRSRPDLRRRCSDPALDLRGSPTRLGDRRRRAPIARTAPRARPEEGTTSTLAGTASRMPSRISVETRRFGRANPARCSNRAHTTELLRICEGGCTRTYALSPVQAFLSIRWVEQSREAG